MTSNGGDRELEAVSAECARIGFDMRELGGLAVAGEHALTTFLEILREIPSGVGLEAFLKRMRSRGINLLSAEEERRALEAEDSARATTCSFCGRAKTDERKLVQGQSGVAICSECVRLAATIVE